MHRINWLRSMAVLALVSVSVLPLAARGHYAHSRYIGKKMVVFILDHGIGPHHRLKDGSELYEWRSRPVRFLSTRKDDAWEDDQCILLIHASKKGIIRSIRVMQDSIECSGIVR